MPLPRPRPDLILLLGSWYPRLATPLLDGVQGGPVTYLTTNYNQTRDLRGDIPVPVTQAPAGASMPTHGAFAEVYPY
jgi:hypothetical protein